MAGREWMTTMGPSRSFIRSRHARSGVFICCLGALCSLAQALSSRDCASAILRPRAGNDPTCKAANICGAIPESPLSFSSRLSTQCAALFESYRSPWSKLGMSNLVSNDAARPCDKATAFTPNNPVIVATNTTATFAVCTVPKSGCSNLRKLLYAIVNDPVKPDLDALAQFSLPHFFKYPTVWLYDVPANDSDAPAAPAAPSRRLASDSPVQWQPKRLQAVPDTADPSDLPSDTRLAASSDTAVPSPTQATRHTTATQDSRANPAHTTGSPPAPLRRLPAHVPTFAIGRNPYLRLLSGFRDKMVDNPTRRDTWTAKAVNTHFGVPPGTKWDNTPLGFRSFVRALWEKGVSAIDLHFQPAVTVCGGAHNFRYDYYLRLEDLQNWFPCWMHGLGLREWTESGWGDSPYGRMLIGEGEGDGEETFVTLNSYKVAEEAKPRWDAGARTATSGERGEDWELVAGDQCWWNPPGQTCAEYYAGFTAQTGAVLPGGLTGGAGGPLRGAARHAGGEAADVHATGSYKHWEEYYDQRTADLVLLLYAADFEAFGYERAVL
eukprot:jgi/Ulvmu1/2301/UM013_0149.1